MNISDFLLSEVDRNAIGTIAEFVGVPDFYSTGYTSWMRTATYVASSNLTTAGKLSFQQNVAPQNCIAVNGDAAADTTNGWFADLPVPRIAGSSISAVLGLQLTGGLVSLGVMTSIGIQAVLTGQTSIVTALDYSANVTSDGTSLWCGAFSATNTWTNYKSTNGTSWASQAQSGLPTFAVTNTARTWPSGNGIIKDLAGENLTVGGEQIFYVYCGAMHLLWASDGTNMMGSLSTNGLAWSGNNTVAMAGATPIPKGGGMHQFYRNGNNNYWMITGSGIVVYRYSTDGGATWAACTGHPNLLGTGANHRLKRNHTTPAKLAWVETGTTNSWFSSDSGATWTARTMPASTTTVGGFAYEGAIALIVVAGVLYRSTNDGAAWAAVTLPIGTLGAPVGVAADANRFYLNCGANSQLLTSTDGLTWTLRVLPAACPVFVGIASYSSSQVALLAPAQDTMIMTNDSGVTWIIATIDTTSHTSTKVGDAYCTPDGGGTGFGMIGIGDPAASRNLALAGSDITAGGYWYRTGTTAVTPLRANALSYRRVA